MADEDMSSTSGPSATIEGVKIQLLYPQSQLVSVKLNEANFLVWKTQILTAIRGYGLEEYLSLDAQIPDKFVVDNTQSQVINPAFTLWNRQDQILASWLLSSLSENILPLMIGLNTSSEIWSVLEKNFASQSKAKTLQYKLQLQTTKKGNMSMREYLAKIKMCCDLLANTRNFVNESDHVMHILAGLGPEYDSVVVTVTAGASTFGLNDVQALLLSFEARLENSMSVSAGGMINTDGSQPSVNLVAQDGNYRRNFSNQSYATRGRGSNGFRGGRRGAFRGRGFRGQGSKIICQVCHISGHSADRCWHRYDQSYGAQSGFQKNDSNTADGVQIRNPSLNMVHMPRNNNSNEEGWWYPDSGASSHVTSDLNSLQSPSEYNGPNKLQMGNGQNEHISHIGNGSLHCVQSDKMFHLNDLLHVPGITKNLISVSRFAHDNNVYFEFHPMFCLVKDQATQQVLLKGIVKEGLYKFNFSHGSESRSKEAQFKFNPYVFASSVCNNLDISLWHKRFGHCSYDIAKKALRDCNILFSNKNCDSSICHSCILAKSHKLPFANSESVSKAPFDLVHSDL